MVSVFKKKLLKDFAYWAEREFQSMLRVSNPAPCGPGWSDLGPAACTELSPDLPAGLLLLSVTWCSNMVRHKWKEL